MLRFENCLLLLVLIGKNMNLMLVRDFAQIRLKTEGNLVSRVKLETMALVPLLDIMIVACNRSRKW